jgi:hypothetical protein
MQSDRSDRTIMIGRFRLKKNLIILHNCFESEPFNFNRMARSIQMHDWMHVLDVRQSLLKD